MDREFGETAWRDATFMASFDWILRVIVAIGGRWLVLRLTGSLNWLFAALAFGFVVYGVALTTAVRSGAWFDRVRFINARG